MWWPKYWSRVRGGVPGRLHGVRGERVRGGHEGARGGVPGAGQCMKVKSESEVAQSCPTPSDPMDCILPGSSAHGIFQARVLEWGAIAFSEFSLHIASKTTIQL